MRQVITRGNTIRENGIAAVRSRPLRATVAAMGGSRATWADSYGLRNGQRFNSHPLSHSVFLLRGKALVRHTRHNKAFHLTAHNWPSLTLWDINYALRLEPTIMCAEGER